MRPQAENWELSWTDQKTLSFVTLSCSKVHLRPRSEDAKSCRQKKNNNKGEESEFRKQSSPSISVSPLSSSIFQNQAETESLKEVHPINLLNFMVQKVRLSSINYKSYWLERLCVQMCVCDWRTVRGLNIDSYTFTADWKAKNCPSSSFEQLCLFFTPAHILHSFLVSTHPWDTHAAEHKTSVSDTAPSLCPPTPVYTSSSPSPSEETMSDKSTCTHWEGSWWVLIKRLCYMSLALLILDAI